MHGTCGIIQRNISGPSRSRSGQRGVWYGVIWMLCVGRTGVGPLAIFERSLRRCRRHLEVGRVYERSAGPSASSATLDVAQMILTSTHAIRTGNGETRSNHHPSGQMRSLCTTQRRDGADACSVKPEGHTVSLSYFECCAGHGATRHGFGIPVAWSRYPWQPIQPQPIGAVPELV
jgi:hypothetical protein